MATQLLKFRLTTSFVTGSQPCDKNIIELNKEMDKGNEKISNLNKEMDKGNEKISNLNKEMLKLNNYIKLIEDKLSCFFDVDDDYIIEGN